MQHPTQSHNNNNNTKQILYEHLKVLFLRNEEIQHKQAIKILDYVSKQDFGFFVAISKYLVSDDYQSLVASLRLKVVEEDCNVIEKGNRITMGNVMIYGTAEVIRQADNSEDETVIGDIQHGQLICSHWLVCGKPSTYSIKCLNKSIFITIPQQKYNKHIKKWLIRHLDHQIQFLKTTSLFRCIDQLTIRKYHPLFFPKSYKYKQQIYAQKDSINYIYLMAQGQIQLSCKIQCLKQEENYMSNNMSNRDRDNVAMLNNNNCVKNMYEAVVKLVRINRGEFFGCDYQGGVRKETAICCDSAVRVFRLSFSVFEEFFAENQVFRNNVLAHVSKLSKIHLSLANKNKKIMDPKQNKTIKQFSTKKKKRRNRKQVGLENIQWWGLAQKVKISQKYKIVKPQSLTKICSRKYSNHENQANIDRVTMCGKINQLKKRILKAEIDDLQFKETLLEQQQNIGNNHYSPWATCNFPKMKVKIKMLDVKPKAIDMTVVTKKKLLTYAKNMSNFCDRLNLQ